MGCDTSEPHVSYISRACSSLVRQPYYAPNSFILKISGVETILATKKGRQHGCTFYMNEYTSIFLFSRCIRCAQKRDCWESVRFASERSRVRIPLGPPICRIVFVRCGVSFCHSLQNRASFVLTAQSDVCRTSRHNVHSFTRSFVKNDNSPIRSTQPPNGCLFKVRFPPTRSTHRERMTLKFFKLLQRNIEDPGATSQTQKSPRKSTT